ncbi:MAG: hypothetical protein IKC03_09150 [Oscillospiraceae bacterium]|nr:hypothetical protein [Oscillospiraceae bacterium]
MQKLLYAINHEKTETAITNRLSSRDFVVVGTVPHREALLRSLESSVADILLYRESLKGSADTFELMKQIRSKHPTVRIIFIANAQSISSKLLARLVFLGIYDIINCDTLPLEDLMSYIVSPRNFGYAEKYFRTDYIEELIPKVLTSESAAKGKKIGFLDSLLQRKESASSLTSEESSVNFETMRGAMLEEARRTAQAELPQLVDLQVKEATVSLRANLDQKDQALMKLKQTVQEKEQTESVLNQQLKEANQLRKSAEEKLSSYRMETDKALKHYQEQLEGIQAIRSPEWYQEQVQKWESERTAYQGKLELQNTQIHELTEKLEAAGTASGVHAEDSVSALLSARAQIRMLNDELMQYRTACSTSKQNKRAEISQQDDVKKSNRELELNKQIQILQDELGKVRQQLEQAEYSGDSAGVIHSRTIMPHDTEHLPEIGFGTETDAVRPKFIPHINNNYRCSAGEGRMVAFAGAKHGLGNTTVALNTAIQLANAGNKTLFVEINRRFPLITELFEFSHMEDGLDTALAALAANKMPVAAQYIIKPHEAAITRKNMSKVYRTLPPALHFLLYSNAFLHRCKLGTAAPLTNEDFKSLSYFLLTQEQYSYVIFDIQADDTETVNVMLNGPCHIHQLLITVNQDPHSITTAGYLAEILKSGRNASLIANAKFVVNQYHAANRLTIRKMSEFLSMPESCFLRLSLDHKGYTASSFTAVPYVLAKERYSKEYETIQSVLQ